MTRTQWLKKLKWQPRPAARVGRGPWRPFLERLEQRLAPVVSLSISNPVPFPEGDSGAANMLFTVTRSGDLASAVQVDYATQNGTALASVDYQARSGTLLFAANQTTATIAVPVIGNRIFQSNRTFTVALTSPMPSAAFAPPRDFSVGTEPLSAAVADFNGDGRPDLAVANNALIGTVSVLLNTTPAGATTPSFAPQATFPAGNYPRSVASGDVNGDGKPDLAVSNSFFVGGVAVLLNTTPAGASIPSFAAQRGFATDGYATSVALADINGDGRLDLAAATSETGTVSVLLNTTAPGASTPSFALHQPFAAGGSFSLAIGDINGDGRPDLAVAHAAGPASVSVLLNTTAAGATTPSFAPQQTFPTESSSFSVALGDVNGDGRPDLAVANTPLAIVSVLLNSTAPGASTPSFAPYQPFVVEGGAASLALGDVNGDGRPDLAVASGYAFNGLSVLLNTTQPGAAAPSFSSQQTFATGYRPVAEALGDFNTDGKPDLAVANGESGTVSVLLNARVPLTGPASFAPQQTFGARYPASAAVGDVNGDGKPDLATVNWGYGRNWVSVLLNTTPAGASITSFAPAVSFPTTSRSYSVALGDFNGDGRPDLAVANQNSDTVSVLLNTTAPGAGTPSFAPRRDFSTDFGLFAVAVGDLNGDGRPDLATANIFRVSVLLNTTPPGAAAPSFAARQDFDAGNSARSVAVADVNGDGRPDLVAANVGPDTVSVLLNMTPPGATTPSFTPQETFPTGLNPNSVAVGDLNGDGRPDLAAANYLSSTLSVLLNTTAPGAGAPSFTPQETFATGIHPRFVTLGDVNGDGKLDVITADDGSNTVSVLLNTTPAGDSTPTFAPQQPFPSEDPWSVAIGDFNGDGKPDLAAANFALNTVSVLLNNLELITLNGIPATGTIADDDAPVSIAIAAGDNQRARVGTAFATALAVDVRNAAGSLVEGVGVVFTAPAGPGGTFPGGSTAMVVTNVNGRATAPTFTADAVAGAYLVTAQAQGGSDPSTNFSLSNTAEPAAFYYIYPGTEGGVSVPQGEVFYVYILPFDENFNWLTDYTGTVTFYAPDPLSWYLPTYTFTGTEGGIGIGAVIFGTLGLQEFYVWNAAVTVFGYAVYDVVPPDGGGAPGSGDAAGLLDEPARPATLVRFDAPALPILDARAVENVFARPDAVEQPEVRARPLPQGRPAPWFGRWPGLVADELFGGI